MLHFSKVITAMRMNASAMANGNQNSPCSFFMTFMTLILQKCQSKTPLRNRLKISTTIRRLTLKRYASMSVIGRWNCQMANWMFPISWALGPKYAIATIAMYVRVFTLFLSLRNSFKTSSANKYSASDSVWVLPKQTYAVRRKSEKSSANLRIYFFTSFA